MSGPREKPHVADFSLVGGIRAKAVLLDITQALHDKANGPKNDACDVAAGAEGGLRVLGNVWRVEYSDGQTDSPDPYHLEDPESEEGEKFVALVVEAIVFASLDDTEEEKGRETGAPKHDKEGIDDLTSMMMAGKCERDNSEDDEIRTACEIWW